MTLAGTAVVGLAAGLHGALYGVYKDSPHESLLRRRFVRELTVALGNHTNWWGGDVVSLTYFGLAVLSALVPWVNAEVVMLSAVPLATSEMHLAWLVALVTIGQMSGKSVMYWMSRSAGRERFPRLQQAIERAGARFVREPASALGVTFLSSTVGFPPFYVVSMAAGALRVAFLPFLIVGTMGRFVHFAAVAFLPHLAGKAL